jgi:hypothetical protein
LKEKHKNLNMEDDKKKSGTLFDRWIVLRFGKAMSRHSYFPWWLNRRVAVSGERDKIARPFSVARQCNARSTILIGS